MNPILLVLSSNLVNITHFTLSKIRYLILTQSKFLSLHSHSIVEGSLSCWTSCTALLPCGTLWPYLCLCIVLHTALKCSSYHIHCISCHTLGTPYAGVLWYNIYSSLSSSSHFHCPFTSYYYHASACLFFTESHFHVSDSVLYLLLCCLCLYSQGQHQNIVCCSLHLYLSMLLIIL